MDEFESALAADAAEQRVTSSGGSIKRKGGPGRAGQGDGRGTLYSWPKGVSGNPAGRAPNRVGLLWLEKIDDDETARAVWDEFLRLALHARSEELRARLLMDFLDRCGIARNPDGGHSATAVAQVVNIIRNSPELGV